MDGSPYVETAKINLLLEVETKIDFKGRKQINRVKQTTI